MAQIGSVGSAVTAALETAGQYMQGQMLEALDGGAVYSLGLLFYMIAAITGMIILTMGGSYKHAFTFLIGPPIFYFLIAPGNRVQSDGVLWRLGLDEGRYDQTFVFRALREVTNEEGVAISGGGDITVTRFFKVWNDIVSNTMQSFVGLILKLGDENSDRSFISKTERYIRLYYQDISDPQLKELINREVVQVCGDYFRTLLYLHNPAFADSIDNPTKARLQEKKEKYEGRPTINLAERPRLLEWVRSVGGEENELYSCRDIWTLAVNTLRPEANRAIDTNASSALPTDMVAGGSPEEKATVLGEVAEAYRAKLAAKMGIESDNQDGTIRVNESDPLEADVLLVNEVAARLLLKQMLEVNPSMTQLQFIPKDDIRREKVGTQSAEVSQAIREISNREEWHGKGDFITAALTMPYLQGLALYFLAMMFPFFAMAIVVPGRHNAFLQWMTLWVWIKSWDVGFAIVMVIDEILYALMPHGPPITNERLEDPSELIKAIFEVDPTYSVNTYYNIMATLMLAVPVLTAGLVKKGAGELIGAITQGAQQFAGKTGNAAALFQGSLQAQSRVAESNRLQYEAGTNPQALARALSDPEVMTGMMLHAVGKPALEKMMTSSGASPAAVQKVIGSFAGATAEQAKGVALAKVKYLLAKERRAAGLSYRNRKLSQRAVMNGWYNHHVIYPIPLSEMKDLIAARNTFQASGAYKKAEDGILKLVMKRDWQGAAGAITGPAGLAAAGAGGAISAGRLAGAGAVGGAGGGFVNWLFGSDRELGVDPYPKMGALSEAVAQFAQPPTPPVDPLALWQGGRGQNGRSHGREDDAARSGGAAADGASTDLSYIVSSGGGVFPGSVSSETHPDDGDPYATPGFGASPGYVGAAAESNPAFSSGIQPTGDAPGVGNGVGNGRVSSIQPTNDERIEAARVLGLPDSASIAEIEAAVQTLENRAVGDVAGDEVEEIYEEQVVRVPGEQRRSRRRAQGGLTQNSEGEG